MAELKSRHRLAGHVRTETDGADVTVTSTAYRYNPEGIEVGRTTVVAVNGMAYPDLWICRPTALRDRAGSVTLQATCPHILKDRPDALGSAACRPLLPVFACRSWSGGPAV
jgi:hypothetical protein